MLTMPPVASSVLAVVTTLHLSLAALRNNRQLTSAPVSSLAVISLAFAALPWMFPSVLGVAAGLVLHLCWFAACEWLVPKPPAAESRIPSPAVTGFPAVSPARVNEDPARRGPDADRSDATRPKGFEQVRVLATFDETPAIRTIRIARPEGFDFEAGQFVTVKVRVDGKEYARCYSISSAPDVRGYLEISVKRLGVVSNALHAAIRPGASLTIRRPAGAFKYPSGDDRPIVLLAGGIGITPLMSILRHAIATEPTRPVTLLYGVHAEADFAFRDELAAAARRHPQLRVQLAAATGSVHASIYPGRIDESLLRAAVPDLTHSIAYLCGPKPMIDAMKALLSGLGVPARQVRHEIFNAAEAASAGVAHAERPASRRRAEHRMTCARSKADVVIVDGQTLLEAAEEGGVAIQSLCRAGVCGTCRIQVIDGDIDCRSATLDAADRSQGFVLACVTTTRTDCTVSL